MLFGSRRMRTSSSWGSVVGEGVLKIEPGARPPGLGGWERSFFSLAFLASANLRNSGDLGSRIWRLLRKGFLRKSVTAVRRWLR